MEGTYRGEERAHVTTDRTQITTGQSGVRVRKRRRDREAFLLYAEVVSLTGVICDVLLIDRNLVLHVKEQGFARLAAGVAMAGSTAADWPSERLAG